GVRSLGALSRLCSLPLRRPLSSTLFPYTTLFRSLIGNSGGGKTTCASLAARFYEIPKGRITIGGIDISTIDPEVLLSKFSIVFRSEEHTSELQSRFEFVCPLLLEIKHS